MLRDLCVCEEERDIYFCFRGLEIPSVLAVLVCAGAGFHTYHGTTGDERESRILTRG